MRPVENAAMSQESSALTGPQEQEQTKQERKFVGVNPTIPIEMVRSNEPKFSFDIENHSFRLVLSYPLEKEFLNDEELKNKLAEFHDLVLEPPDYTFLYRVKEVGVGRHDDYFLLCFNGTVSGRYLEVEVTEIISLLVGQLEGFFACALEEHFSPLYFELDGQVVIEPTPETKGVPASYDYQEDFWDYLGDVVFWNFFIIDEIAYLLADGIVGASEVFGESVGNVSEFLGEAASEGAESTAAITNAALASTAVAEGSTEAIVEGTSSLIKGGAEVAAVSTEVGAEGITAAAEVGTEVAGSAIETGAEVAGSAIEAGAEAAGGLLELIGNLGEALIELIGGLFS